MAVMFIQNITTRAFTLAYKFDINNYYHVCYSYKYDKWLISHIIIFEMLKELHRLPVMWHFEYTNLLMSLLPFGKFNQ